MSKTSVPPMYHDVYDELQACRQAARSAADWLAHGDKGPPQPSQCAAAIKRAQRRLNNAAAELQQIRNPNEAAAFEHQCEKADAELANASHAMYEVLEAVNDRIGTGGIDGTDQRTGHTFREMIQSAMRAYAAAQV
jgi:hypothetical protein